MTLRTCLRTELMLASRLADLHLLFEPGRLRTELINDAVRVFAAYEPVLVARRKSCC